MVENRTSRELSRNVPCPKCFAKPNEPCIGTSGKRKSSHEERHSAAIAAGAPALSDDTADFTTRARSQQVTCPRCKARPGRPCIEWVKKKAVSKKSSHRERHTAALASGAPSVAQLRNELEGPLDYTTAMKWGDSKP